MEKNVWNISAAKYKDNTTNNWLTAKKKWKHSEYATGITKLTQAEYEVMKWYDRQSHSENSLTAMSKSKRHILHQTGNTD